VMGAWVEAGIMGAVFWIGVLSFPVRVLKQLYTTRDRLTPLVAFAVFLMTWDILFSPFAAWARVMVPFYIVLMVSYLPSTRRKAKAGRAPVLLCYPVAQSPK
jgi:O-antigen ligase